MRLTTETAIGHILFNSASKRGPTKDAASTSPASSTANSKPTANDAIRPDFADVAGVLGRMDNWGIYEMTYEYARDVYPRSFSPIEAANEYLRLFVEDAGLAAGFRVGCRRHFGAAYADFRRYLKLMGG